LKKSGQMSEASAEFLHALKKAAQRREPAVGGQEAGRLSLFLVARQEMKALSGGATPEFLQVNHD
jgi:hypothetical protein